MSSLRLVAMRQLLLLVLQSALGSELPALKMSTFDAEIMDILWLGQNRKKVLLNTKQGHDVFRKHQTRPRGMGQAERP